MEAVAREHRELYRRHHWVATLLTTRPPLGPGLMAKYEHELAAFDGLGLDDVEMDAALTLLLGFVQSVARADLDAQAAARDSAMSDTQWWAANAPLLARVFDAVRSPPSRPGSEVPRVKLTRACTAPNTPSASGCSASWTASPTSS